MNRFDKKNYFLCIPLPSLILGVHLLEIVCGTLIVCLLAITAATHQKLYSHEINYDSSHIPLWIILGILVSTIGIFISSIFVINRVLRFAMMEFITSIIMIITYVIILVLGVINIPECYKLTEIRRVRCVAPKIALFFSFIAIMSYTISAIIGGKVCLDRRKNSI